MFTFKKVTIDELKDKGEYVKSNKINEFGITPTCLYAPYCNAEYTIAHGYFVVRYTDNDIISYSISEAIDDDGFLAVLNDLIAYAGKPIRLEYVSAKQCALIKDKYSNAEISTDTDQYDYLYKIEDFIKLSGKVARHKREHYNHFITNYKYEIKPLSKDNIEDCKPVMKAWCERKECANCEYCCERDVIYDMFARLDDYPADGVILYMDGKPAAFFIYEAMGDTIMGYHQKTVDASIEGLSNAIYIDTLSRLADKYTYFNFGPDIGIPGLRQFKRQFKPFELVEKYTIKIN